MKEVLVDHIYDMVYDNCRYKDLQLLKRTKVRIKVSQGLTENKHGELYFRAYSSVKPLPETKYFWKGVPVNREVYYTVLLVNRIIYEIPAERQAEDVELTYSAKYVACIKEVI